MNAATPVLVTSLDFDEPLRTQARGTVPQDATSFIATTLKSAGIDVPCSLYNEALTLARDGLLGQAQQRLQMLLCLDPDDADALLLSAKVHAAQGRPGEAIVRLEGAVAAGALAPAGFRESLDSAIRTERLREEELAARLTSRDKTEVQALRSEARALRSEAVRLEVEASEARERESTWKWVAIGASLFGTLVIVGLMVAMGRDPANAEVVADEGALPTVAVTQNAGTAVSPSEGTAVPPSEDIAVAPTEPVSTVVSQSGASDAAAAPAGVVTHVVGSGDTLYKLANKYYGDSTRWERIRDANKSVLGGKIDLKLGTELVIP